MVLSSSEELIRANIFLYTILPLLEVIVEEDKKMKNMIKKWNCVVQFEVEEGNLSAHLIFSEGKLKVKRGYHPHPSISLIFKDVVKLNENISGKKVIPKIKGIWHIFLLLKVMKLLNSLNILKPESEVTDEEKKRLKVRLLLYTVTNALSELAQRDEYAQRLLQTVNNKIVQWKIKPNGPYVYANIDKSGIKTNIGIYEKRPYLLIEFPTLHTAYQLFCGKIDPLEASGKRIIHQRGPAEFGLKIAQLMKRVDAILNPK